MANGCTRASSDENQRSIASTTSGWMIPSRSLRACGSAKTTLPSFRRSSPPAESRTEGPNRAFTASKAADPGATALWARTSASIVGTPSASNTARTWLLPVAIPPVRPTRFTSALRYGCFLGWCDPFLHECIPFVALGALPEQLGAAIAAVRAHMRVEVEHRIACQRDIAPHQILVQTQRKQRLPDLLVHDQPMRIVGQRREEQVEGFARVAGGGVIARQRQPSAPVLRIPSDQLLTQGDEPLRRTRALVRPFEPFIGQICAFRDRFDQALPRGDGSGRVAALKVHVAQVEIGRGRLRIDIDRLAKHGRGGFRVAPPDGLGAELVAEKTEDLLILGPAMTVDPGNLGAHALGVRPLLLILVQLLQVDERVAVFGIELHDFLKRFERAIDESAMPEIQAEAEQHVGVLETREVGALQQRLVHGDGAGDLPLLPVEVAEDHLNFEGVGVAARGGRQFLDGLIDLMLGEEVQAEHVVRCLAQAAAIDPPPVAQLVSLPRLARDEANEQGQQGGEKGKVLTHGEVKRQKSKGKSPKGQDHKSFAFCLLPFDL